MEGIIIKTAAHVLGVIGMAGVWLIPAHAWTLINQGGASVQRQRSTYGVVMLVLLSAVLGVAVFAGAIALPVVFRCLYESRCTGSRGGSLFFLDLFGVCVVLAEVIWQAARLHGIRRNMAATLEEV
jgi:hypothetical protein